MTILSIRTVGDPVLRSECEPITVFDRELAKLIDDMLDTMYDVEGVGLAGPQIGISKQIMKVAEYFLICTNEENA